MGPRSRNIGEGGGIHNEADGVMIQFGVLLQMGVEHYEEKKCKNEICHRKAAIPQKERH